MRRFIDTVATALHVESDAVEAGAALILEVIRGVALPQDRSRLLPACPYALELLDFDRRRPRSGAVYGPPPQTTEGLMTALAELGLGDDAGRLFVCFMIGFVTDQVGEETWSRVAERAPVLSAVRAESKDTGSVTGGAGGDQPNRSPLSLPESWDRGELPAWRHS